MQVHQIVLKRALDDDDLAAVTELLDAASEADAHPALGEHAWLDLVQGGRAGFAGLVAWEPDHPHPVGYAQVSLGENGGNGHPELGPGGRRRPPPPHARATPWPPTW